MSCIRDKFVSKGSEDSEPQVTSRPSRSKPTRQQMNLDALMKKLAKTVPPKKVQESTPREQLQQNAARRSSQRSSSSDPVTAPQATTKPSDGSGPDANASRLTR